MHPINYLRLLPLVVSICLAFGACQKESEPVPQGPDPANPAGNTNSLSITGTVNGQTWAGGGSITINGNKTNRTWMRIAGNRMDFYSYGSSSDRGPQVSAHVVKPSSVNSFEGIFTVPGPGNTPAKVYYSANPTLAGSLSAGSVQIIYNPDTTIYTATVVLNGQGYMFPIDGVNTPLSINRLTFIGVEIRQ